jgi:spore coat-associated protein N
MNKRILLSSISIFSSLALVTGGTFAFFSDSGTSTGNVFAAGTLILKLTDNNETAQDNVTASFGRSGLLPGDSVTGTLEFQNTGTVAGDHIEIDVGNTNSEPLVPLDRKLQITALTYDGGSILAQVTDTNGNGYPDLGDLDTLGLDNLALTDRNTLHTLSMTVQFRDDAGDEYQGDTVSSSWTVTLNQHPTQ